MARRGITGVPGSFRAKYVTRCLSCDVDIEPGELANYNADDQVVHQQCLMTDMTRRPKTTDPSICPSCNMDHAGECF